MSHTENILECYPTEVYIFCCLLNNSLLPKNAVAIILLSCYAPLRIFYNYILNSTNFIAKGGHQLRLESKLSVTLVYHKHLVTLLHHCLITLYKYCYFSML